MIATGVFSIRKYGISLIDCDYNLQVGMAFVFYVSYYQCPEHVIRIEHDICFLCELLSVSITCLVMTMPLCAH